MLDTLFCTKFGMAATFKFKTEDNVPIGLYKPLTQVVYGSDMRVCNGCSPVSPCPLCPYCGCGPFEAEWKFIPDKKDPTRYVGSGSALKGNCCLMCTNHDGDNWYWSADSLYTAEKPGVVQFGLNPLAPPCLAGVNMANLVVVADRKGTPVESSADGAPAATEITDRENPATKEIADTEC